MKHTLLCVDDETDNVEALERLFRTKYNVLKATSGSDALKQLKKSRVSLIISDQRMPVMTGVEFLEKSIEISPDSVRMLLTGYTDLDSVISAINSGQIYRYVTKPWDPRELSAAVDRAVERFELSSQLKEKNAALAKALKELQVLDEAKNNFMILINHELKTPLTALISFLELLKETTLDAAQSKYLNRIEKSADRLKEIVFDVLDFISAESGIMPVHKKKTNLKTVLESAVSEMRPLSQEKNQSFDLKLDALSADLDEKIIRNVLRRILHNAIKFGEAKKPIFVSISSTSENRVRVAIENSGENLSEEMIDKIQQPFAINEQIMNHSKGLGLGLSLSRAMLKRHDSSLNIQVKKGQISVGFEL